MNGIQPERWYLVPIQPGTVALLRRWSVVCISLLGLLVLGFLLIAVVPQKAKSAAPANKVPLKIDTNPAPVNLGHFTNGYAPIIDPALPAVVNISSTKVIKQQNMPGFWFNDPLFRQFFGDQFDHQPTQPQTEREHSLGSGVIVNSNGYILTNNHVVEGASISRFLLKARRSFALRSLVPIPAATLRSLKLMLNNFPR